MLCPCQSQITYNQCCRLFHNGKIAPTVEALMRSRYSAYVQRDAGYLHKTWHPSSRPPLKQLQQFEPIEWLGLEIIRVVDGSVEDQTGLVEFIAHYQPMNLPAQRLHEVSRFVRERGRWLYVAAVE